MTSSNGNIFRVTGPLCGEFTGHRWIPLMFTLICALINGWVSNREAGDWRRHRAHYDVTVTSLYISDASDIYIYRQNYIDEFILKSYHSHYVFCRALVRNIVITHCFGLIGQSYDFPIVRKITLTIMDMWFILFHDELLVVHGNSIESLIMSGSVS